MEHKTVRHDRRDLAERAREIRYTLHQMRMRAAAPSPPSRSPWYPPRWTPYLLAVVLLVVVAIVAVQVPAMTTLGAMPAPRRGPPEEVANIVPQPTPTMAMGIAPAQQRINRPDPTSPPTQSSPALALAPATAPAPPTPITAEPMAESAPPPEATAANADPRGKSRTCRAPAKD